MEQRPRHGTRKFIQTGQGSSHRKNWMVLKDVLYNKIRSKTDLREREKNSDPSGSAKDQVFSHIFEEPES